MSLPDPSDIVLQIIQPNGDVRDIRWSELVSMMYRDSGIGQAQNWVTMLGASAPMSSDVEDLEAKHSSDRVDLVLELEPLVSALMQIMSLPSVAAIMLALEIDREDPNNAEVLNHLGDLLHVMLVRSSVAMLSVMTEIGLILPTETKLTDPEMKED